MAPNFKRSVAAALFALAAMLSLAAAGAPARAALEPGDRKEYELAFRAIDAGRWEAALRHARRAREDLPLEAVLWLCHQSADCPSTFGQITRFIDRHPTWPRIELLARRAEAAIDASVTDADILNWFRTRRPQTGTGALRWLAALERRGDKAALQQAARQVWAEVVMGPSEEHTFRQSYRTMIPMAEEIARLDRLLWDGHIDSARRQARRVPRAYRDLAEARIALRTLAGGVDGAIARVAPDLVNDPGLIYERLRWRRRKDRNDDALDLLAWPEMQATRPDLWWTERAILARRAFNDGQITRAYRLAADHGSDDGADFAEAEWFAGWVALRYLRDPELAFPHFRRMHERVSFPVSLSRAAYWAGRAADQAGHQEIAQKWYAEAAQHGANFYGQMAALKLPVQMRPPIPTEPTPTDAQARAFEAGEFPRLIRMLEAAGADQTARVFVDHFADQLTDPTNLALLGRLTRDMGRPDYSVRVAREALKKHVVLSGSGYPEIPMGRSALDDTSIVYGLIRQESGFDVDAQSHAGARGLMQLMPTTAQVLARMEGVPYHRDKLTDDPQFNMRLGTVYLRDLLEEFDGYLPMALAAYNAGPGRVRRWADEYGDPRSMTLDDQIDWMESIPFAETRNYVQRVMEGITVYRQRAAGRHVALNFTASLK